MFPSAFNKTWPTLCGKPIKTIKLFRWFIVSLLVPVEFNIGLWAWSVGISRKWLHYKIKQKMNLLFVEMFQAGDYLCPISIDKRKSSRRPKNEQFLKESDTTGILSGNPSVLCFNWGYNIQYTYWYGHFVESENKDWMNESVIIIFSPKHFSKKCKYNVILKSSKQLQVQSLC